MKNLLETVNSPEDVKKLNNKQLIQLCSEIRTSLINSVSKTGGHLASNLGVVEISVAFHNCFNCPTDAIVFDVGHQCYTHKLLTGRKEGFSKLRSEGGTSGFPKPSESSCDTFIAGHSGTALSSAIGLAKAKQLSGDNSKTVALIGDGSMANGMFYEAINSLDASLKNLIVILNDNEMSISKSVGAFAEYLLYLRTDFKYSSFKRKIQDGLEKIPKIGPWILRQLLRSKSAIRRSLYHGTLFEELGFNYIGPVDGHDIDDLCRIFENVKHLSGPILIHAITVKGKGFALAEENPGAYHGVGKFNLEEGNPDISNVDSFSNTFGKKLSEISVKNEKICAITAAMKYGTGLQYFAKQFPERFFDVGIAEEHAVTFCGGLSKGGMKPIFAVYSTFLQRAFDQLFHDVTLSNANVLIAIDRAGFVGEDGETHQGIFDAALLSTLPRLAVASPCNYNELEDWLERLVALDSPAAIRFPRGKSDEITKEYMSTGENFDIIKNNSNSKTLVITYGREFSQVLLANEQLPQKTKFDILKLNVICPIDKIAVELACEYNKVLFFEEGIKAGGIGEHFLRLLNENGFLNKYSIHAIDFPIIPQASVQAQLAKNGLDAESIKNAIQED